jgi:hypothetical protein
VKEKEKNQQVEFCFMSTEWGTVSATKDESGSRKTELR